MADNSTTNREEIAQLKWQVEAGADEAVEEAPVNRFEVREAPERRAPPAPAPQGRVTAARAPAPAPAEAEQMADQIAGGAKTLEDLEAALQEFRGCSLKATAMKTVFADGNPKSRLMLVGEAPGSEEDRLGKPFVGPAGRLLDRMMAALGMKRENDYYISNILPWRPPGNRKPTPAEITICLPFIRRHIELADPKVLVLLGGTAVSALLNISEGITRVRGRWYNFPAGDKTISTIPTFHPAYLLRSPQYKGRAWQDLLEIQARL